jgi:hypothetical protein
MYLAGEVNGAGPDPDGLIETDDSRTDDEGRFTFRNIQPGSYVIEALTRDSLDGVFISDVTIDPDIEKGSIDTLPDQTLRTTGALTVNVIPEYEDTEHSITVQIYGTDRLIQLDPGESFVTGGLAPASYLMKISSSDTTLLPGEPSLDVISGDTAVLNEILRPHDYASWGFSAGIVINTSAGGVDVRDDCIQFPLLIRLDSTNFDFSRAQPGGADLRFTSAGGKPLPHEIERWDAAGLRAEIWVNVDTILGNNSSQYINMHWGRENTLDLSSPDRVFDTAFSYQGVWHLGTGLDDASTNGMNGSSFSGSENGLIGAGHRFDGTAEYDSIPYHSLLDPGIMTLSFWVATTDTGDSSIWHQGTFIIDKDEVNIGTAGWAVVLGHGSARINWVTWDDELLGTTDIGDGNWHYVTVMKTMSEKFLYIDGALDTSSAFSSATTNIEPLYFGSENGLWEFFQGFLDEVRISGTARSADWIKLCYENQRGGSTVVRVE